jgi:hypothetical protein
MNGKSPAKTDAKTDAKADAKTDAKTERERRLADKLRENLKRRKAQIRGRVAQDNKDARGGEASQPRDGKPPADR